MRPILAYLKIYFYLNDRYFLYDKLDILGEKIFVILKSNRFTSTYSKPILIRPCNSLLVNIMTIIVTYFL